jgi:hypothetical protein
MRENATIDLKGREEVHRSMLISRLGAAVVILITWVLGLTSAASSSPFRLPAQISLDGVSGVFPGLTPTQVARRWGLRIALGPDNASAGCQTAEVRAGAMHGYALFENKKFGAVWFDRGAATATGIKIRSTLQELRAAYPAGLFREPNPYQRGAFYYFVRRKRAPHYRIRFDVGAGGRVTQIGFGGRAVGYIEGCA